MPTISPFTPQGATTVSIVASTGSANVKLPTGGGSQIRVAYMGSAGAIPVYVALGTSTVTASTGTDMPMFGGLPPEKFTVDPNLSNLTYLAAIASASTASALFITRGEGF